MGVFYVFKIVQMVPNRVTHHMFSNVFIKWNTQIYAKPLRKDILPNIHSMFAGKYHKIDDSKTFNFSKAGIKSWNKSNETTLF